MADKKDLRTEPSDDPKPSAVLAEALPERNEELCNNKDVEDTCLKLYTDIEKGFQDQWERANSQMDFWDIYNCELGPKQFYSGNSKIFVPIIADAVDARKTRFTNQIFPSTGKNVEVISSEDKPQAVMSLLEFYIRKARLRSVVVPALMKNGDIEGQYNIMMHWTENERNVAWRVQRNPAMPEDPELELDDEEEGFEDIEEETIVHGYPTIEVLPDADVLILPHTAATAEEAVDMGGSVTVLRRYSKAKIEEMIADGEIDEDKGEELLDQLSTKAVAQTPDKKEKITDSAGVKKDGGKAVAYVYVTYTKLTLKDKNDDNKRHRRICRIYFGGEKSVLSCKRNPFWCDHVPIISAPSDRTEGSAKGRSRLKRIESMQYAANDAVNEGMDSAAYALLPIVMTDPLKNPRVGSMILNVAAVWETNPNDTKFAQFPQLWKDAFEIVASCKNQIFQSLGVNPAMLPSGGGQQKGGKTNQAQVAQEQQIDIMMTADVVTGVEADILTPILRWFVYLDHQFRDKDLTIRQFGILGLEAEMETVPPVQMDRRFEVKWFGVEAARAAQQIQLQMAGINVVRGIPQQMYQGYELNLAPVVSMFMENLFGPRIAREVFVNVKQRLSLDPLFENTVLLSGMHVPVSPMDEDQQHLKAHMEAYQQEGDPTGVIREHMMFHAMSMQKKTQQAQAQQQQGLPGSPGGAGPGTAGQPRVGGKTAGARGGQQPAGAIHGDQIRDPSAMPRQRGLM